MQDWQGKSNIATKSICGAATDQEEGGKRCRSVFSENAKGPSSRLMRNEQQLHVYYREGNGGRVMDEPKDRKRVASPGGVRQAATPPKEEGKKGMES